MPTISVIMPVYNTEKYVGLAIESILNQTFKNFEFIIIDDCSTDNSYEICEKYAEKDDRIKLFRNEKNEKIVYSLNKGIKLSTGNYIVRMDADDISNYVRFKKQLDFLERNIDVSIVGSNLIIIDENGKIIGERIYPCDNNMVRKSILKKSPLAHPSVMIRKLDLERIGYYNENFTSSQDYELWLRFFDFGYKIGNIQENLLKYRVFEGQSKNRNLKLTLKNTIKIQSRYLFTKKYFNVKSLIYNIALRLLLILPNNFILLLFKKIEYKK